MNDQLLGRIIEALDHNSSVHAAWLAGSRGRGTNDEFSDIDIWVAIDDTAIEGVVAEPLAFVHEFVPTVLHVVAPQNGPPDGSFILTWVKVGDTFQQVDWYLAPTSTVTRAADTQMIIGDVSIRPATTSNHMTSEESIEKVKDNLLVSMQEINNLVKHAKRGRTWQCVSSARNADNYLVNANWILTHSMFPRFEDRAHSFLIEPVPGDVGGVQRLARVLLDTVSDVSARAELDDVFAGPIAAMRSVVQHWQGSGWIPPNEYYRTLPRRRLGAGVLITDPDERVLLLETTYKKDWEIPGGVCESGESPRATAEREVAEEIGYTPNIGRLLVFDHRSEPDPKGDAIMLVYDAGVISDFSQIRIDGSEISAYHFVPIEEVDRHVKATMAVRLRAALEARYEQRLIEIDGSEIVN